MNRPPLRHRPGADSPVVALLRRVGEAAAGWAGGESIGFDLADLADADLALLADVLGSGEVTGRLQDETVIAEAVCPGVWQVCGGRRLGLEIGEIPVQVRDAVLSLPYLSPPSADALPDGVMNALPVLGELAAHAADWRPGAPVHGVSLSLLPLSAVDRQLLEDALGEGPIAFESGGYGFVRVRSTGRRQIWHTRFFNSQATPIQHVLEICDIPAAVRATAEDVRDGGRRLLEIIDAL